MLTAVFIMQFLLFVYRYRMHEQLLKIYRDLPEADPLAVVVGPTPPPTPHQLRAPPPHPILMMRYL